MTNVCTIKGNYYTIKFCPSTIQIDILLLLVGPFGTETLCLPAQAGFEKSLADSSGQGALD